MTLPGPRRALAALVLSAWALAQAAPDDALLGAAHAEQHAVLQTLERLVNIETGTGDAEGMAAMAKLLSGELHQAGAQVIRHKAAGNVVGDNVVGVLKGTGRGRVLLMAHMDTVYPRGVLARAPFRIDGARAFGAGIADAKGGVATVLHAMRLLKARPGAYAQVTALFNTDEERGSVGSRDLIQQLAGEHDAVLSFEPTLALREGFARGTSGVGSVQVRIKGRASHAGAAPELGVNALTEAADLVLRTQDLDDRARGLRFNWTIAKAGGTANIIPEEAELLADVRYVRNEDLVALEAALRERAQNKKLPEAQIDITVNRGRPAFNADALCLKLIELARSVYAEAGGDVVVIERSGGGTDAAYAALSGKPVLEGLGLPGFGYHSNAAEYVMIDAIPRRLYMAVRLVQEVGAGALTR
ncbi:acetylornithine deacetylase/succinyldiaminopimelate desuccinylase-like deacylase [Burkholderiales bacterium JOSHI_001]|nr:acetylornithine deacetylase/succinyldiaminopimelate desuccinylase-like deacylase [Burkholderiales bacterium JOSHI_001]